MQRTAGYIIEDEDRRCFTCYNGRLYYGRPITLFTTLAGARRVVDQTRRRTGGWPAVANIHRVGYQAVAKDGRGQKRPKKPVARRAGKPKQATR